MTKGIKGNINWSSKNVQLCERIFLFCFEEKCMSGRINRLIKSKLPNQFEIHVDFIEPEFFKDELIVHNTFTIREASKVLGKGEVIEIIHYP